MGVSWIMLVFALLLFASVLVAVPVALIALIASPEFRRTAKTLAARVAPVGLAGVVLALLWMPARVVVHQEPPHAEVDADHHPATLVQVVVPEPVPAQPRLQSPPAPVGGIPDRTVVVLWPLVILGGIGLGVLAGVLSPFWRKFVWAGVVCVVALGGASAVYFSRQQATVELRHQQVQAAQRADAARAAAVEEQRLIETLLSRQAAGGGAIPVEADAAVALPDVAPPVVITSFTGEADPGRTVSALPEWVESWAQAPAAVGTQHLVLTSRRYADVQEAEQELLQTLQPRLDEYLRDANVPIAAASRSLPEIRRLAVQGRVQEQFLVELSSSQEPVYRVTWQVALTPELRDALVAEYQFARRDERVWQLGVGFALVTLVFGSWAAYFRLDDATQGRYRGRLKLAAAGASLAVLGVTMLA